MTTIKTHWKTFKYSHFSLHHNWPERYFWSTTILQHQAVLQGAWTEARMQLCDHTLGATVMENITKQKTQTHTNPFLPPYKNPTLPGDGISDRKKWMFSNSNTKATRTRVLWWHRGIVELSSHWHFKKDKQQKTTNTTHRELASLNFAVSKTAGCW